MAERVEDVLRSGLRLVSSARARHRHRARMATSLTTRGHRSRAPRVLVLTPDFELPSAGVRVMYRHVEILRAAGVDAWVLHARPGFRCTWFESDAPVTDTRTASLEPDDLLVVGELDVDLVARLAAPVRHLVLNQSGHLAWNNSPEMVSAHYASPRGPEAIIATSQHIERVCRFAFPGTDVRRVGLSVDPHLFHPLPTTPGRQLAYMPRRGADDAELVMRMLAGRGSLAGWRVLPIRGMDARGVAAALRDSSVFLSVSPREGFGMPPLEAMASGAYVVGYPALGGSEFMQDRHCAPVATGDVLALAMALEEALGATPDWRRERGLAAAAFAHEHYAPEKEAASVLDAYAGLVAA